MNMKKSIFNSLYIEIFDRGGGGGGGVEAVKPVLFIYLILQIYPTTPFWWGKARKLFLLYIYIFNHLLK